MHHFPVVVAEDRRSSPPRPAANRALLRKILAAITALCAAIGLTAPAAAERQMTVAKNGRVAIFVVSDLSAGFGGVERLVYNIAEDAAIIKMRNTLTPHYRRVIALERQGFTAAQLRAAIMNAGALPGTSAPVTQPVIDLFIVSHGSTETLQLYDPATSKTVSMAVGAITTALEPLPANVKARLRAVISVACYGDLHAGPFLEFGFKANLGSKKIVTDTASAFQLMLDQWVGGATIDHVVDTVNARRIGGDRAGRVFYTGRPHLANNVDSTRVLRGDPDITINRHIMAAQNYAQFNPVLTTRASHRIGKFGGGSKPILCPVGYMMTGLHGRTGAGVDAIGPICNQLPGYGNGAEVRPAANGGSGGQNFVRKCKAGEVLSSLTVRAGQVVEQIVMRCAPVVQIVSGQPLKAGQAIAGHVASNPIGSRPRSTSVNAACGSDRLAVGLSLRSGTMVDRIGLRCGKRPQI